MLDLPPERAAPAGGYSPEFFPKDGSGPGRWLMSPELFEKIRELPDAGKILKDVLTLEREPEFFTIVTIPDGTGIRFGGVNAHPSWGRGGVLQFEIMDKWKDDWFSGPQRIKR